MRSRRKYDFVVSRRGHDRLRHMVAMVVLMVVVASALTSCGSSGCNDNRSALPKMGFYAAGSGQSITIDSLEIGGVGAPDGALLLNRKEKASWIYLPFRFEKPSTSFYFHYEQPKLGLDDPRYNDTITFCYTSTPYFASVDCGSYYKYNIEKVEYTTHLIESVEVTDSIVSNIDQEHIRVYFRAAESLDESGSDIDAYGATSSAQMHEPKTLSAERRLR